MKFSAAREAILKPLQAVIGVVERRQTMPILSNVMLRISGGKLAISATDLEVELIADGELIDSDDGEITVPGRKLHDICRALPDGVTIQFSLSGERATVKAGRSRFTLSTLSASDFPTTDQIVGQQQLQIPAQALSRMIAKTHFSMAQQDVRYYLNGLLLETETDRLRAVATDGHRLALSELPLDGPVTGGAQIIVPRKGVLELNRLLGGEGEVTLTLGSNLLRIDLPGIQMTTKLIDGRFPEYGRVIPSEPSHIIVADCALLKAALQRAAILSNEKYRGVRLELANDSLIMQANNPEQEEAEESLEIDYDGEPLEIGFNVNYLLDALGGIDTDSVEIGIKDGNSSCLIREPGKEDTKFVVMPMRL